MGPASLSIAFVLPNFNHAEELKTSLPALLAQTRPADGIIIVDDGSTDDSVLVIKHFCQTNPTIRLVRHEHRLGVAAAVNRGIREAVSQYVVLVSADERVYPEMLGELEAAILLHPTAKLAVSFYSEWYPNQDRIVVHGYDSVSGMWYLPEPQRTFMISSLLKKHGVYLHVNTAVFQRQALLEVGGFDPALRWHSDWFAIYAIALRHGFCAVPRSLALYRVDEDSYSTRGIQDRNLQHEVMRALLQKLRDPQFSYFRSAVLRSPVLLSPFMRSMLTSLLRRPVYWKELFFIYWWWLGQFVRGRRPGILAAQRRRLHGLLPRSRGSERDGQS